MRENRLKDLIKSCKLKMIDIAAYIWDFDYEDKIVCNIMANRMWNIDQGSRRISREDFNTLVHYLSLLRKEEESVVAEKLSHLKIKENVKRRNKRS